MSAHFQLQKDVAAFLASHSEFTYVPIVRADADVDAGDALTEDIEQQLLTGDLPKNGKVGLCVVLGVPKLTNTAPNSHGPVEDFEMLIQVIEHKGNNMAASIGTQIRCDDLAESIRRLLNLHVHDGAHGLMVIDCVPDTQVPDTHRSLLIRVQTKAHVLTPYEKTARPVLSLADPLLTITCATAGASIYYTINGDFPGTSATAYSGPVDVGELPNGTLIRAAAFKSGLRGSDVAQLTL